MKEALMYLDESDTITHNWMRRRVSVNWGDRCVHAYQMYEQLEADWQGWGINEYEQSVP